MSADDAGGTTNAWVAFDQQRPPQERGHFWFRVPPRNVGGLVLRPEWIEEMRLVGMGYADDEYWPGFSNWDGYQRTLERGAEWRPLDADDHDDLEAVRWGGLNLAPCPFCAHVPKIEWSGPWIGAPVYRADSFRLWCRCGLVNSGYRNSLEWLAGRWNSRAEGRP